MFRRKRSTKVAKSRATSKARKVVKRLSDKPTAGNLFALAELAAFENLQPFRPQPGTGLGDLGACRAVAEVMKLHPEDKRIQTEGCRAVEALADRDEENVLRLGLAECCQLVEGALEKFPDDAELQAQGCRAITNLFNGEANSKQLVKGNACVLVTSALDRFPEDHEVQIEACGAIANLANNSNSNRVRLGRAGACELVTKSMSAFPDNIDVQHAACVAVGNLANRHAENKKKLGAAGACDKVCAALVAFQGDVGVQYMGCGAVGNLSSSNAENCNKFGEAGGCLLVTAAMNAFPNDRNLQHVGCAGVANLAIGNAENAQRLVKAGARLAVQRAMDKYIGDQEIQTRGSQALQWLSSKPRRNMSQTSGFGGGSGRHERRSSAYASSAATLKSANGALGDARDDGEDTPTSPRGSLVAAHSRSSSVPDLAAIKRLSKSVLSEHPAKENVSTERAPEETRPTSEISKDRQQPERADSSTEESDDGKFFEETASELSMANSQGRPTGEAPPYPGDIGVIPPPSLPPAVAAAAKMSAKTANGGPTATSTSATYAPALPPPLPAWRPPTKSENASVEDEALPPSQDGVEATRGANADGRGSCTGQGMMGPAPPSGQAPTPGMVSSGGAPAAPNNPNTSKPSRKGMLNDPSPEDSAPPPPIANGRGLGANGTKPPGSKVTPIEANIPLANNSSCSSSTASVSHPSSNGFGGDSSSMTPEHEPNEAHRELRAVTQRAAANDEPRRADSRPGSGRSEKRGDSGSRGKARKDPVGSNGLQHRQADDPLQSARSSGSRSPQKSWDSRPRSSKERHRRWSRDLLEDPAMSSARQLTELVRTEEAVVAPLHTVLGRDPATRLAMVGNIEQLLRRSQHMEAITAKVLRDESMITTRAPLQKVMKKREYFNVLYTGLCGAHVAAALVARGGIVADSKDGWLRKASALLSVVAAACPIVKPGVAMLGKTLQLADRIQMADYLEQVAKDAKNPLDVSCVMEQAARRLVEEGRPEISKASLDAHRRLEQPTREWLPAWLLEEASASGNGEGCKEGPPGTESARRAGVADGCVIIKAIGSRTMPKVGSTQVKVEALVQAIAREGPSKNGTARSATSPSADKSDDGSLYQDTVPDAPPSADSSIMYPPVSPSTLPPGQPSLASPTGSAIGALRRAEAAAAAAAVVGTGSNRTSSSVKNVARITVGRKDDDTAEGSGGVPTPGSAAASAFVGSSARSDDHAAESPPHPAPPLSRSNSRNPPGYAPPSWATQRLNRTSTVERSNSRDSSDPPGYRSATESTPASTALANEERLPGPAVRKVTVPEVFKKGAKTAPPPAWSGSPSLVGHRKSTSMTASGGLVGPKPEANAGDRSKSPTQPEKPQGLGIILPRRGKLRGSAVPGPASPARSSSPTATSRGRQIGPRRLKVAGKGAQPVDPKKQRAALGITAAGGTGKASPSCRASPRAKLSHPPTPGKESVTPRTMMRRSPRATPVVMKSAITSKKQSPRRDANGEIDPRLQSLAEARKSWGRSGSWYEPRPERVMSQVSAIIGADATPAKAPSAADFPSSSGISKPDQVDSAAKPECGAVGVEANGHDSHASAAVVDGSADCLEGDSDCDEPPGGPDGERSSAISRARNALRTSASVRLKDSTASATALSAQRFNNYRSCDSVYVRVPDKPAGEPLHKAAGEAKKDLQAGSSKHGGNDAPARNGEAPQAAANGNGAAPNGVSQPEHRPRSRSSQSEVGSRKSLPHTPGSKPKSGSIADKLAEFGDALRLAVSSNGGGDKQLSSNSRREGPPSVISRTLSKLGGANAEEIPPDSTSAELPESPSAKKDREVDEGSPENRLSTGSSRFSSFLSGSKFSRSIAAAAAAQATGRDSFGSSDEDTDEDMDDDNDMRFPEDDLRSAISSKSSRGSMSFFGSNRSQSVVGLDPEPSAAERPRSHGRAATTTSVGDIIKRMEKKVERQHSTTAARQPPSNAGRWFRGPRK